jgi:hypothetical protein
VFNQTHRHTTLGPPKPARIFIKEKQKRTKSTGKMMMMMMMMMMMRGKHHFPSCIRRCIVLNEKEKIVENF